MEEGGVSPGTLSSSHRRHPCRAARCAAACAPSLSRTTAAVMQVVLHSRVRAVPEPLCHYRAGLPSQPHARRLRAAQPSPCKSSCAAACTPSPSRTVSAKPDRNRAAAGGGARRRSGEEQDGEPAAEHQPVGERGGAALKKGQGEGRRSLPGRSRRRRAGRPQRGRLSPPPRICQVRERMGPNRSASRLGQLGHFGHFTVGPPCQGQIIKIL